jgi:hypothetical protein
MTNPHANDDRKPKEGNRTTQLLVVLVTAVITLAVVEYPKIRLERESKREENIFDREIKREERAAGGRVEVLRKIEAAIADFDASHDAGQACITLANGDVCSAKAYIRLHKSTAKMDSLLRLVSVEIRIRFGGRQSVDEFAQRAHAYEEAYKGILKKGKKKAAAMKLLADADAELQAAQTAMEDKLSGVQYKKGPRARDDTV